MLRDIISQLYRIAELLKTKKLVDKDSNDNIFISLLQIGN